MYRPGYKIRRKAVYPGTNSAHYPSDTPVPPGTPYLWYSAQDINLASNSGISDGAAVASWKNKGSAGAAGDLAQGTGAAKPTFKLIGTAGKLGNKSSVSFDGGDFISVAAGLTLNQTDIIAVVVRTNNTGNIVVYQPSGGAQQLSINSGGPWWHLFAGTDRDTNIAPTTGNYHVLVTTWAGASSAFRADKVSATLPGSPGTANGTGMFLGSDSGGTSNLTGEIVEVLAYANGSATAAQIEAYFDSQYGSTWPQ